MLPGSAGPRRTRSLVGECKDGSGLVRSHVTSPTVSHPYISRIKNTNTSSSYEIVSYLPLRRGFPGGKVPRYKRCRCCFCHCQFVNHVYLRKSSIQIVNRDIPRNDRRDIKGAIEDKGQTSGNRQPFTDKTRVKSRWSVCQYYLPPSLSRSQLFYPVGSKSIPDCHETPRMNRIIHPIPITRAKIYP